MPRSAAGEGLRSLDETVSVTRRWLIFASRGANGSGEHADSRPETTYWIRSFGALLEGRAVLVSVRDLSPEHRDNIAVFRLRQDEPGAPPTIASPRRDA